MEPNGISTTSFFKSDGQGKLAFESFLLGAGLRPIAIDSRVLRQYETCKARVVAFIPSGSATPPGS